MPLKNLKPPRPVDDEMRRELGSPYGPQPHGVDESAGGADSSPFENEATDDRKREAEEKKEKSQER